MELKSRSTFGLRERGPMNLEKANENLDQACVVSSTPLFDAEWYLSRAPRLELNSVEAFSHYLTIGWAEGRDPCPFFDTAWYLATNLDTVSARVNPLLHYISWGEAEGR